MLAQEGCVVGQGAMLEADLAWVPLKSGKQEERS